MTRTILIAITAALVALVALAPLGSARPHHPFPRVCFSKQTWSAADGDRPCAYIELFEDGTFRSQVEQADGDKWVQR